MLAYKLFDLIYLLIVKHHTSYIHNSSVESCVLHKKFIHMLYFNNRNVGSEHVSLLLFEKFIFGLRSDIFGIELYLLNRDEPIQLVKDTICKPIN